MPQQVTQYSKCSMNDSSECAGVLAVSVVCGAASMPITPPLSAQAFSTWSGFMRLVFHSAARPRG